MAKKAKRLVSESRTQLIDCRRLLHCPLSTGTSPFSPEPRSHRPSIAAILSFYARHPVRALDTILRQGMPRPL